MVKKLLSIVLIIALVSYSAIFTMAYAVDNNCKIIIAHLVEMPIALGCIEDRLDALENKPVQSGSENTSASNLGNGQGVFAQEVGDNLQFKSLGAGDGVSLQSNSTVILINSTSISDNTVCANVGSGSQIYKDGECNFRTVLGSPDISVSQQTDTITIDYNGTLVSDKQVGQVVAQTYLSLTKTNIGTGYSNVYYTTAFDEEHLSSISFTNATYFKIIWIWDYVGTGNQQCKWIDASGNILYETTTFALDRDGIDSGWLSIPAGMNEPSLIRWQCKSTVAGDDPVAKGYKIMTK